MSELNKYIAERKASLAGTQILTTPHITDTTAVDTFGRSAIRFIIQRVDEMYGKESERILPNIIVSVSRLHTLDNSGKTTCRRFVVRFHIGLSLMCDELTYVTGLARMMTLQSFVKDFMTCFTSPAGVCDLAIHFGSFDVGNPVTSANNLKEQLEEQLRTLPFTDNVLEVFRVIGGQVERQFMQLAEYPADALYVSEMKRLFLKMKKGQDDANQ